MTTVAGERLSVGVLHSTFESWGGAEWFVHGLLCRFAEDDGFEATLYTHRWTAPPGEAAPYPVVEHRLGGVLSGPWDWRRIARRYARRWARHDVLFAHNHPALEWAVRAEGAPPIVWYCHEPPRHVWGAELETSPEGGRAGVFSLVRGLRAYGARLPLRAWSRLRLGLAMRAGGARAWREKLQRWDRHAVGRCAAVLANSRFTAGRVQEVYGRDATVVYPLPPDFDPSREPRSAGKDRIVLWVGRLTAAKRPLEMAAAWEGATQQARDPAYRLVMVGDGPLRPQVEGRFAPLKSRGLAELQRRLSRDALLELYGRAVLTVHLSSDEPFGLVPLESMWQGTPVLAVCEGGVAETVVPGKTGWCLPDATHESLVEALRQRLAHPEELERTGVSASAYVRERFSFAETWRRVCAALAEAARRGQPRRGHRVR